MNRTEWQFMQVLVGGIPANAGGMFPRWCDNNRKSIPSFPHMVLVAELNGWMARHALVRKYGDLATTSTASKQFRKGGHSSKLAQGDKVDFGEICARSELR